MENHISFILDGRIRTIDFSEESTLTPTTTVLEYLRRFPDHKGVKEGCAEGDCGACTVVLAEADGDGKLRYRAVNSCLIFLPMLHGKQLITVENLKSPEGKLHPAQQALVEADGTQCGFCTPGIVMSLFALKKENPHADRRAIEDAVAGNLCRCTGYKPIVEAGARLMMEENSDWFSREEQKILEMLAGIPREGIRIRTENQAYFRPTSLPDALKLRAEYPEAVVIDGATDVALRVTKKHEHLPLLIDLGGVPELREISQTEGAVVIGAGVSVDEVLEMSRGEFPALAEMLEVFGSRQIRNLATLGGNLGTGSPIGDTAPVLMAYQARVVLQSAHNYRELPLEEFFLGYRQTALQPDELITRIVIPRQTNGALVRAYKISRRRDLDIATLSAGFRLERDSGGRITGLILAYGGMAEMTRRAANTEKFLIGKQWERGTVEEAMEWIDRDFRPISDVRGSAEFRRLAARNLLLKFFIQS